MKGDRKMEISPRKFGYVVQVPRELIERYVPTPEEQDASRRRMARYREASAVFRAAMDAVSEPHWRAVLDLHKRDEFNASCEGCDMAGYEAEQPEWPCRTVKLVAERCGIKVPDYYGD